MRSALWMARGIRASFSSDNRALGHLGCILPHARARERVVPISELVFGTLAQNRSSLEPSLGFAAIAGRPRIVDRVPYVQALEEPQRDPKRLWRTRLDDGPASRPQTGPQKSWGACRNSMLFRPAFRSQNHQQRDRREAFAAVSTGHSPPLAGTHHPPMQTCALFMSQSARGSFARRL
jgi:hypothetical protein